MECLKRRTERSLHTAFLGRIKRLLIGAPIPTARADHERLTKFKALAVCPQCRKRATAAYCKRTSLSGRWVRSGRASGGDRTFGVLRACRPGRACDTECSGVGARGRARTAG